MQIRKHNSNKERYPQQQTLPQILNLLQGEEFIDPYFQHSYQNVYGQSTEEQKVEQIIWMPCEQLHPKPVYNSLNDMTQRQIRSIKFSSSVQLQNALIVMKYLIPHAFQRLVKSRQLSYQFQNLSISHLYAFQVLLAKQKTNVFIDSYVPVSEARNIQLFTPNYQGSLFPCLIQKLLAKVCQGYQNIGRKDITEIIQLFSFYPIQKVRINQFYKPNSQQADLQRFQGFIKNQIIDTKNLLFFKTRNNPKLHSFGIRPNHPYLISGYANSQKENQHLVTFLELPQQFKGQQTNGWIGKFSKFRIIPFDYENQTHNQVQKYQNFMSFKDLIKISRSLIVLHNTTGSNIQTFQFFFRQPTVFQPNNQQIKQIQAYMHASDKFRLKTQKQNVQSIILAKNFIFMQKAVRFSSKIFKLNEKGIQSKFSYEKTNFLLNIRVQTQTDIEFNKVTIIFCSLSGQKEIYIKNCQISSRFNKKGRYCDLIISSSQKQFSQIHKLEEQMVIICFLDGFTLMKQAQQIQCKLIITLFDKKNIKQPNNSCQDLNPALEQIKEDNRLVMGFFKNLIQAKLNQSQTKNDANQNNNQFSQNNIHQLPSINCYQFIDKLNMGLVHIKLNPTKKLNEKVAIIKIEMDSQKLFQNGIFFVKNIGCLYQQNELSSKMVVQKYKISKKQPEIMLLFRISVARGLTQKLNLGQNQISKLQFPPADSIRISRIFQMKI